MESLWLIAFLDVTSDYQLDAGNSINPCPSSLVVPDFVLQVLMAIYQIPRSFFGTCSLFVGGLVFLSSRTCACSVYKCPVLP